MINYIQLCSQDTSRPKILTDTNIDTLIDCFKHKTLLISCKTLDSYIYKYNIDKHVIIIRILNRIIKNETSKLLSPKDILEKDILGLNLLFDELNDLFNKIKSNKDNQDLLKIREYILKLNDGFKHLKAITEKKTSVKLNLINCDIISILESVKKELGCYHTFDEDILKF